MQAHLDVHINPDSEGQEVNQLFAPGARPDPADRASTSRHVVDVAVQDG